MLSRKAAYLLEILTERPYILLPRPLLEEETTGTLEHPIAQHGCHPLELRGQCIEDPSVVGRALRDVCWVERQEFVDVIVSDVDEELGLKVFLELSLGSGWCDLMIGSSWSIVIRT